MVRFGSAVATMQTASVNLSASFSRIMDTDYAAETASQAKNNILQQAGTAVLAQANQTPNTVLTSVALRTVNNQGEPSWLR